MFISSKKILKSYLKYSFINNGGGRVQTDFYTTKNFQCSFQQSFDIFEI